MNPKNRFPLWLDPPLAVCVGALVGLGLVMVFSSSSAIALKEYGDPYFFVKRQALAVGIGLMGMLVLSYVPYRLYAKCAYPILGACVLLLLLTFFPGIGREIEGTWRWIRVGPFSFQPSEATKIALVIYMAYSISKKGDRVQDFSTGYLPHLIVLSIPMALILLQRDLGTCVLLGLIVWTLLFTAGAKFRHLLATAGGGMVFLLGAILIEPYRRERFLAFWDPWSDPLDRGFQIIHSFLAFGSGGILGVGLGDGKQKLFYLPEPHTDFIFSVLGEELGLVGVAITVALYVVIFWRGIQIARAAKDPFGSELAFGLNLLIAFQVLLNLMVTLGLTPTKGMPLPFLSYGGSAMTMNLCAVGILFNIRGAGRRGTS